MGAVIGGLFGHTIDNWPQVRNYYHSPSLWLLKLRFLWESCVTREWEKLVPLLGKQNRDIEASPAFDTPTTSCQVCHGLIYDTPHREQTPGVWKMRPGAGFDLLIEDLSCPYPRICDWVLSATQGCISCQIVVDAVSAYAPDLFNEYTAQSDDLGLGSVHIRAIANQAKPLGISICRPWIPWQSDREEYLEVFTDVDSPRCWPTIGSSHPVCPNNFGHQAIQKIERWIKTCKSNHTICARKNKSFYPKRLIEIFGNGQIRLIEPREPCSYVALSYCWGTQREGWLRTLTSNIDHHKQSIDKEQLPQGLFDAIILAKALGFHSIWIDALCIIQDDGADLNSELVRMGALYACADLVIGVDTSSDCTRSLKTDHAFAGSINYNNNGRLQSKTFQSAFSMKPFITKDGSLWGQPPYEPYFLKLSGKAKAVISQTNEYQYPQDGLTKLYVRENKEASHQNHSIKTNWRHLDTRCWTLQETRLASRFLTLGMAEMKWRCVEASFCECYESSNKFERGSGFVELSPVTFHRQEKITQQIERKQRELFSELTSENGVEVMHTRDLFEAWELLISDFSKRKILKFSDRLPAMAGVMSVFDRELNDSNIAGKSALAGLWKTNILKGMLWRSIVDNEKPAESYCRSIIAPEITRIEQSVLLKHFRLDALLGNLFIIHAYACGKPCFASSIYWPILMEKPKLDESWPTDNVPSWSWLSVFGPVKYWEWLHGSAEMLELQNINQLKFVPDAHVLHAYTWPSPIWKEDIPCGEIRLKCRLAPVKLKSILHGTRDPDFDFYKLYRTANFGEDEKTLPFMLPPLLQNFIHFACLENSPALMQFIPDIPCVFGGNDPSDHRPLKDNNQWLIDLINQEYQALLQHSPRNGGHLMTRPDAADEELFDMDYDFHKFMPCVPSQQLAHTMASNTMCMGHNCGCGRRWTNTESYPATAAYIGSCHVDGESGRRFVHKYFLILMPSLHQKEKAYHRIGIAFFRQLGSSPGYHDLFSNADWEEVAII